MSLAALVRIPLRTVVFYKARFPDKTPFELKDNERGPIKHTSPHHEEDILNRIRTVQQSIVTEPSPFHLVCRLYPMTGWPWWEKIILRNLGLHDKEELVYHVIPNTPFFNTLLCQVKHRIRIRPMKFPDGIPKEEDIGRCRIDTFTGELKISDEYKPSAFRYENAAKPKLFETKYLGHHIRARVGWNKCGAIHQ